MNEWTNDFDHWEICGQCCINLFRKTLFAYDKIYQLCKNEKEFVKRVGFALIGVFAAHDKKMSDETLLNCWIWLKKDPQIIEK